MRLGPHGLHLLGFERLQKVHLRRLRAAGRASEARAYSLALLLFIEGPEVGPPGLGQGFRLGPPPFGNFLVISVG